MTEKWTDRIVILQYIYVIYMLLLALVYLFRLPKQNHFLLSGVSQFQL